MHTSRVFASLLLVALAGPALASLAVPATVEGLARGSDAVVRGTVESVTARRTAGGKRIFTYVEVAPSSVWRGSAPARITVAVPGGVVDDIGQRVSGAPTFTKGEDVVLFLRKLGDGEYLVHGLSQGKFAIVRDQARPDLSGFAFVRGPGLKAGERRVEAMDVSELERRVRAVK